jgi:hypothetical protein
MLLDLPRATPRNQVRQQPHRPPKSEVGDAGIEKEAAGKAFDRLE